MAEPDQARAPLADLCHQPCKRLRRAWPAELANASEPVMSSEGPFAHHAGIIVLPCGAGKTLVGITAAARIRKSILCLVTNSVSVDQWRHQFTYWTNLQNNKVSRYCKLPIRGGDCDIVTSPRQKQPAESWRCAPGSPQQRRSCLRVTRA